MNSKNHFVTGLAVAGSLNLVWQVLRQLDSSDPPASFWDAVLRTDIGELAAFSLAGGVIGILPDLIEPATDPNHRNFFHSLTAGAAMLYGAYGRHSERWQPDDRAAARIASASYLSHLFFDALTPKSLPWI